jgi:hypothetical protein
VPIARHEQRSIDSHARQKRRRELCVSTGGEGAALAENAGSGDTESNERITHRIGFHDPVPRPAPAGYEEGALFLVERLGGRPYATSARAGEASVAGPGDPAAEDDERLVRRSIEAARRVEGGIG